MALAAAVIAAAPSSASARVRSYIVEDAQTGAVLEAHNADVQTYPASLAKLMTLYITFHRLATGQMTLSERLPVSYHAAAQPPTKLNLRPGGTISVQSAILGITTRSANDAAVVLAEAIGGTETNFAAMMNQTAQRLGMTRTTFRNASGLPNPWQKTTARDMATLALAIIHKYPQDYHYFGVNSFDFRGETIDGFDYLLAEYPGADGMKTGYTYASGYNLVTSAMRDGRRLLGVVMGGTTAYSRDRLMEALLNRGFGLNRSGSLTAESQAMVGAKAAATVATTVSDVVAVSHAPRAASDWLVQLGGVFRGPYPVKWVLNSALRTDPRSLEGATPVVVRLRRGGYLARFSNLTEAQAQGTCQVLRGRRFTCRILRDP
jgi:D-alanyl-D-alanine carboxypeptidase